jgi:hypothetical protein
MPARSLNSRVLRWPKADVVIAAARKWASALAASRRDILRIGYFGSYARGDWGVGSDLDILIVLNETSMPFHQRALLFESPGLPVPAEMLVYTAAEWEKLMQESTRFSNMLKHEVRWFSESHSSPTAAA